LHESAVPDDIGGENGREPAHNPLFAQGSLPEAPHAKGGRAIPEIGWPAMTMDFPVAASIDLRAIKLGTRVNFTIEQGQGGMYEIKAITPAGDRR
jgi:hypothetical protein